MVRYIVICILALTSCSSGDKVRFKARMIKNKTITHVWAYPHHDPGDTLAVNHKLYILIGRDDEE